MFQALKEDQKNSKSKFRRSSKLAVKTRAEKECLLYAFLFSLYSSDKPNDAQTYKSYSLSYQVITPRPVQTNSTKILKEHFRAAK